MRTDTLINTSEKEPHGFVCRCGGIIHFGDEELTPPATEVTCGFCGREGVYIGDYVDPTFKLRHDFEKTKELINTTFSKDEIREMFKSLMSETDIKE